ncbi:MAG: hypothetical protein SOT07_06370 [Paludibacteraceae bacterium]|nr:hypothetical protein [Paludibacteraceae bacterium]
MNSRFLIGIALCGLMFAQGNFALAARPADSLAFRRALSQRNYGIDAFKQGYSESAQDSLIAAYDTFMRLQRYDYASLCLYERAIEYMNIGAFDQMEVLMRQLETLTNFSDSKEVRSPDRSKERTEEEGRSLVLFNYYSVASAYYAQLDSGDLAIRFGELSIQALEQLPDPEQWRIIPPWNYYNQALYYDFYTDPRQTDSIEAYLRRAEHAAALLHSPDDRQEVNISIQDMWAWLHYYRKQYRAAEETMREVLAMIDSVAEFHPNTVVTERGEAYAFMVMLCTEQGRYREALDWQERLIENNAVRYDIDKTASLQEIETRYEVEKKTLEMERLQERNLAFRRLLYLLLSLLLCAILLIVALYLRKKNTEARLYEAALEADNMRSAMDAALAAASSDKVESGREMKEDGMTALQLLADNLIKQLQQLPASCAYKTHSIARLQTLDIENIAHLCAQGNRLTNMDKRYILCFAAGMSVEDVADLFHIEPASVYTVRYRLRKKFPANSMFPY